MEFVQGREQTEMNDVVCKQAGKAYISCSRHAPVLGRKQLSWTRQFFGGKSFRCSQKRKHSGRQYLVDNIFCSVLAVSWHCPAGLPQGFWRSPVLLLFRGRSLGSLGRLLVVSWCCGGLLMVSCWSPAVSWSPRRAVF